MASAPRAQFVTLAALVVAIGCGGGKPQEASAKSNTAARPLQLAQAPEDPATAQPSGSAAITGRVGFGGDLESARVHVRAPCLRRPGRPGAFDRQQRCDVA